MRLHSIIQLAYIHSFIHSGNFYSAPSSPLLLRGAPEYSTDTVSDFYAEAHRQLQVKDLPKVPTWRYYRAGVELTALRLKVIVSTLSQGATTSHICYWFKLQTLKINLLCLGPTVIKASNVEKIQPDL